MFAVSGCSEMSQTIKTNNCTLHDFGAPFVHRLIFYYIVILGFVWFVYQFLCLHCFITCCFIVSRSAGELQEYAFMDRCGGYTESGDSATAPLAASRQ